MKYYLLTFNEDWADEHNVPALACFSESEYNDWLNRSLGRENKKFDEKFVEYLELKKTAERNLKLIRDNNLYNVKRSEYPKELEYLKDAPIYVSSDLKPDKAKSYLHASLGNSGYGFEEAFSDYLTGQDFVDASIVNVIEVDESFKTYFDLAGLSSLSLCNIFDRDIADDYYDEEDD